MESNARIYVVRDKYDGDIISDCFTDKTEAEACMGYLNVQNILNDYEVVELKNGDDKNYSAKLAALKDEIECQKQEKERDIRRKDVSQYSFYLSRITGNHWHGMRNHMLELCADYIENGTNMEVDHVHYEYKMPSEVKEEFTKEKMVYFLDEFKTIFNLGDDVRLWNDVLPREGTCGWYNAFKNMCIEYGLEDVLFYYDKLEWYDSDLFDDEFGDLLFYYNLIESGSWYESYNDESLEDGEEDE